MTGTFWLSIAAFGAVLFVYACVSADKGNKHNGRSFTRRSSIVVRAPWHRRNRLRTLDRNRVETSAGE